MASGNPPFFEGGGTEASIAVGGLIPKKRVSVLIGRIVCFRSGSFEPPSLLCDPRFIIG